MRDVLSGDIDDMMKRYADDGKVCGVHMAIPTGEVLDEDNSLIEVLIYGKSYFAKPCMSFGSYKVPDKRWLEKYKDEIMVWVAFENGNPAHPVYMGVVPRDDIAPSVDYPEIKEYKTTDFKYSFNDVKKLFNFSKINDIGEDTHKVEISENGITISDTKDNKLEFMFDGGVINLVNEKGNGLILNDVSIIGKGTGSFSGVLGELLVELLTQTTTAITQSITTLSTATIIVNPTTYVGTMNPSVISSLSGTLSTLAKIQGKLITILSKNVKLD